MPLIGTLFLAVAAGLLLGTGAAFLWAAIASLLLAVAAWWRRDARLAALSSVVVVAALLGRATRAADRACAKKMAAVGFATVELSEDLGAGGSARGKAVERGCAVRVRLSGNGPASPAGSLLRVRGRIARRGELLVISQAEWIPLKPPAMRARLRGAAGRRIDALYGEHAPLARALLLADEHDIEPEVRSRYADAGIVHMLSVSGLHVAVLAEATLLLLLGFRAPVRVARWTAVFVIAFFVLFVGAPAPAVRAATMYGLGVLALQLQRPTSPWAILATGGLLPLSNPRTAGEIGFQLTIAGMAGLTASGALSEKLGLDRRQSAWARLVRQLLATSVASLATAPIVAWYFGRVSLVAPLTNLVAAPLFGVAQPALFLSLLLPMNAGARLVADGTSALLSAIDRVAVAGAVLPGAAVAIQPSPLTVLLAGAATAAFLVACTNHFWARPLAWGMTLAAVGIWWPLLPLPRRFEVHMIDVGQGDAIALRTPKGRWILVDAGGGWRTGDAGQRTVVPYLRRRGGELALLVLSHPHADHIGGAASVLAAYDVGQVLDAGFVEPSETYMRTLMAARSRRVRWRQARAGDTLYLDGLRLSVLAPDDSQLASAAGANQASLVLSVEHGAVGVLLAGDAEAGQEATLVRRFGNHLGAQLLKVGHHGSRTSSTDDFLAAVRPLVALVSVGAHNLYGHPSGDVLRGLAAVGAQVLRSDIDGSTVVVLRRGAVEVRTQDTRFRLPLPGAP